MSEAVEYMASLKAASQEKRAGNREASQRLLAEAGISYTSANEGVHLVVVDHGNTWDFWPGTGKWCRRGTRDYYRGVARLIRAIEAARPDAPTFNCVLDR